MIRILLDMNLSPAWVPFLEESGFLVQHWSKIGDPTSKDRNIMVWAESNGFIIFTHDLDFGTALALSSRRGPSVFQVRSQAVTPARTGEKVLAALRQHEQALCDGALVVFDEDSSRARLLPIGKSTS